MALVRLTVSVAADTTFARDRLVNSLAFNIQQIPLVSPSPDLDALCHDLADLYNSVWHEQAHETTVTAYPLEGPLPHDPATSVTTNVGNAAGSNCPREVALCLSFYADRNKPRHRGRIYLPICTTAHGNPGPRPTQSLMDKAIAMANGFKDLGGADVDWMVWSTRDNTGRNVQEAWCDDEWDTMRSRGMRPTTRTTAHIGE